MKKLRFIYEMKLQFENPVENHVFKLRCIPANNPVQQIYGMDCRVTPGVDLTYHTDCFGNQVCIGRVSALHTEFGFRTEGIAFVDHKAAERTGYHEIYRYASVLTEMDEGLHNFYEACCHVKKGELDEVLLLTDSVYRRMTYRPGVTGVDTGAAQAFQMGAGVCQDYSHILLALLRHGGIPARYVAGLLEGEGKTHAWTEVWLGGQWVGVDPTHNRLTDDSYIKLSHGRDYRDCMPNRGRFTGHTNQSQYVFSQVTECPVSGNV